jgi:hypothetical protein
MNHGEPMMSDKDKRADGPDDATERELIDMEFQSMVEGLSLDESAPTSYLDELDKFEDQNRFIAPNPPRKNISQSIREAISALKKWKNGKPFRDDDGVAL